MLLQLPLACLRGQTYDGAANMAGVYNGAQALARQEQPLALFVHCISHCVNLATEAAMTESNVNFFCENKDVYIMFGKFSFEDRVFESNRSSKLC